MTTASLDTRLSKVPGLSSWGLDRTDATVRDRDALSSPTELAEHLNPNYVRCDHLDLAALAMVFAHRGDTKRLMVNMPPQVGKTFTVIEWGAFWWLCHRPRTRIVIGSYGDSLAEDRGDAIRRLVTDYGARYGLYLEPGSKSKKSWRLTSGGGVRSVGIGSGITGHPADLILIDDPIKSRAEAESPQRRKTIRDWYSADLLTRLSPGGVVVLLMTPWHPDDLRAQVLADEGTIDKGGPWLSVVMPALATSPDDPLGRAPGDPLPHPKLGGADKATLLDHWQTVRGSTIPRDWDALYQCDPRALAGALLTWELLRARRCWVDHSTSGPCADPAIVAVSIDPSGGGRDTAGIVGGYKGVDGRLYLTDDRSGVMSSDAWGRAACELAADTGADRFVIERNYGGDMAALVLRTSWAALRREQPHRFSEIMPRIVEVTARRGKVLRAEPIGQQWKEDRIRTTRHLPDVENEWASFRPGDDSPGRLDASVHLAYDLLEPPASGSPAALGVSRLAARSLLPWGR